MLHRLNMLYLVYLSHLLYLISDTRPNNIALEGANPSSIHIEVSAGYNSSFVKVNGRYVSKRSIYAWTYRRIDAYLFIFVNRFVGLFADDELSPDLAHLSTSLFKDDLKCCDFNERAGLYFSLQ